MSLQQKPGCEFCDKRGLPVLIARYATAPESAGAPKTKVLDVDRKNFGEIGGKLHYTRRLLRSGYLYVFDEARNQWEGYFITPDAYLLKFKVGEPVPAVYSTNPQPCVSAGHQEVAGMVTIRDPKNASNVWFRFSDVEWTAAVLQKYASQIHREKHMQKLDVQAALNHAEQPNVHPIKELGEKVAEFACDPLRATAPDAFFDSPFKFNPRRRQLKETLAAADALRKNAGIILSLHDPSAVATELAAWLSLKMEAYLTKKREDPDYERKRYASSAIVKLRAAVMKNAEDALIASRGLRESLTRAAIAQSTSLFESAEQYLAREQELSRIGTPTKTELDRAIADAWRKYSHHESEKARFDEAAANEFYEQSHAELEKFVATEINPLGIQHTKWMTSGHMAEHMEFNYDETDIQSGEAYLHNFTVCIAGTEGVKPCFDQYVEWLQAKLINRKNLLLRALTFNFEKLANALQNAVASDLPSITPNTVQDAVKFDFRSIPLDAVNGIYKGAIEAAIGESRASAVAVLIGRMSGPLMKAAATLVDTPARMAIALLGMHSRGGIVHFAAEASREFIRSMIVRGVLMVTNSSLTRAQVQREVDHALKIARIREGELTGNNKVNFVALLSKGEVPPRTLNELNFRNFKNIINTDVRMGVCGGILQAISLNKLIEDEAKALVGDKDEAAWRLRAGKLALAGTLAETIGVAIENATKVNLRWAQGLRAIKTGYWLRLGGRAVGLIGAAIMAVWDFTKGSEEMAKGNSLTAGLYFASATFGVLASFGLVFFASNPITWILVLAYVGVVFWLEHVKDNAIQSWLERCVFGFGIAGKYQNGETEMNDLKRIFS